MKKILDYFSDWYNEKIRKYPDYGLPDIEDAYVAGWKAAKKDERKKNRKKIAHFVENVTYVISDEWRND